MTLTLIDSESVRVDRIWLVELDGRDDCGVGSSHAWKKRVRGHALDVLTGFLRPCRYQEIIEVFTALTLNQNDIMLLWLLFQFWAKSSEDEFRR